MAQEEINKDLNSYIQERKSKPFWKKYTTPKLKPKESEEEIQARIDAELKKDIEKIAEKEEHKIPPADREELAESEEKLEAINEVEEEVEELIEVEKEGTLKKFFKKLNFSKKNNKDKEIVTEEMLEESDDEELRELLHGLHNWIVQLPEDKLKEFKTSKEFELYTKYLRKHNLIK